MKKIYGSFFLLLAIVLVNKLAAQDNPNVVFHYKAKFTGIDTPEKEKEVISMLKTVFKTESVYDQACTCFTFKSKMSINSTAFNHLMEGEGLHVESFEKQEVATEPKNTTGTESTTKTPVKK